MRPIYRMLILAMLAAIPGLSCSKEDDPGRAYDSGSPKVSGSVDGGAPAPPSGQGGDDPPGFTPLGDPGDFGFQEFTYEDGGESHTVFYIGKKPVGSLRDAMSSLTGGEEVAALMVGEYTEEEMGRVAGSLGRIEDTVPGAAKSLEVVFKQLEPGEDRGWESYSGMVVAAAYKANCAADLRGVIRHLKTEFRPYDEIYEKGVEDLTPEQIELVMNSAMFRDENRMCPTLLDVVMVRKGRFPDGHAIDHEIGGHGTDYEATVELRNRLYEEVHAATLSIYGKRASMKDDGHLEVWSKLFEESDRAKGLYEKEFGDGSSKGRLLDDMLSDLMKLDDESVKQEVEGIYRRIDDLEYAKTWGDRYDARLRELLGKVETRLKSMRGTEEHLDMLRYIRADVLTKRKDTYGEDTLDALGAYHEYIGKLKDPRKDSVLRTIDRAMKCMKASDATVRLSKADMDRVGDWFGVSQNAKALRTCSPSHYARYVTDVVYSAAMEKAGSAFAKLSEELGGDAPSRERVEEAYARLGAVLATVETVAEVMRLKCGGFGDDLRDIGDVDPDFGRILGAVDSFLEDFEEEDVGQ